MDRFALGFERVQIIDVFDHERRGVRWTIWLGVWSKSWRRYKRVSP